MPSHHLKNETIRVEKTLFWKAPRPGCRLNAHIIGYTGANDRRLIGFIREEDFNRTEKNGIGQTSARIIISDDHGRTWNEQEPFSITHQTSEGLVQDYPQNIFFDQRRDTCLFFYLRRWIKDVHTAALDIKKYSRQLYRISRDGGRTWGDEQILIQTGPDYNQTHYLRGVRFGYNAGFISNEPLQRSDGTLLVPFFIWPWDDRKQKAIPSQKTSALLMATWSDDGRQLHWDLGQYIKLTNESGCLSELTAAELQDGSILGIMRSDPKGSPGRMFCLSRDGGETWCTPRRLTFDNGEPLYSPSSISRLIRSSRNGKLYWIANLLPFRDGHYVNLPSNLHRFALQIAEVNEHNFGIKKQTVTVIDKSKNPTDPREYSNACVYEDRDSGNLILTMCEASALPLGNHVVPKSYSGSFMNAESFTSHSYKYEIQI